ncbi:gamma-aminobutyric acid receptor subunit alpha-5-like [Montipora capricornis]|uniref:gamma-aminobutyric acid receptor subunit alpha-5-like n=1 Tax=Montipora capricornis TaxID=246305 RepID=UPI0035F1DD92
MQIKIVPLMNITEKPVLVSLYAAVDSFHDIKEEEMEYKVELILKENWKDPRLAYGNASWFVRLKGDTLAKVWYPDTLIENSRKHVVDDKTRTAFLFGDGTMFLSEWIKATLTSHMEFHRYPMDTQTLRLQIAAYSYDDTQVRYEWSKLSLKERDMTEFYVHEQSLRLESSAFITGAHTAAVAEFQIRRRLQHYIMGFYLPCITCTCCSWIQFWMAVDEIGDRAGLGIATVLTEIFLLEFSSHGMPKVSYVKAAELYVVVSFAFIFSALVESAVVYKASAIILKGNTEDGKKDNDQDQCSSVGGKKSRNKVFTTSVDSTRICEVSNIDFSSCNEAVDQSTDCIVGSKPVWENELPTEDPCAASSRSLGSMIDHGSRFAFPLIYITFTIVYFALV